MNRNLVQSGLNSQVRTLAQQASTKATNNTLKSELNTLAKNGVREIGTEVVTDKAVEKIRAMI
jgi:hypothetical protein